MARIAGIDLPNNKLTSIGLTGIYGIGRSMANKILVDANVTDKKSNDLSDAEVSRINSVIEQNYKVEGQLRQEIFRNIKRLKDIRSYRGVRHKLGLPVRGQNTRSNAITRKGKSAAVGGLARKLEKK